MVYVDCGCDKNGSTRKSLNCNNGGICECKKAFTGEKCNKCKDGFDAKSFPNCIGKNQSKVSIWSYGHIVQGHPYRLFIL